MQDTPKSQDRGIAHRLRWCILLAAACLALAAAAPAGAAVDSRGTDFWLTFPSNFEAGALTLFIAGETATSGTVAVPGLEFSEPFEVTPGSVTSVVLPAGAMLSTSDTVENLGIHVTAAAEVTVYGLDRVQFSTDAFLGLPTDALGTDYVNLGYVNASSLYGSELAVVGSQDGTVVTITPTADTPNHTAGEAYTVDLDQGQTYQLIASDAGADLSGTIVTSTKPVGLFGGHQCANVPDGTISFCDHLVEEIPPTTTWGKRFVTMPLATRLGGDTFRFTASTDGTSVTINGDFAFTLDRGQVVQRNLSAPSEIVSTKPILVMQYSNGTSFDDVTSDPFMMMLPPSEQFLASYTVSTPASGFASNYVNVVAPSSEVGSVKLDGVAIPAESFTAIGTSGYSGAQVSVTLGSHTLTGPLPFGVSTYGFDQDDSYGYPGGANFSAVATVATLALSPKNESVLTGTDHCVTASVKDSAGAALEGIRVDFTVTGANPGSGFTFTNASGEAQHCYTGANDGADTITAAVGGLTDTAQKQWSATPGPPSASINDVIVAEGNAGSTNATFTVTLSAAATQATTVQYATANGAATAGADYTTSSGTVSFAEGETQKTLSVPVLGDTLDEVNETFDVNLSNPSQATISDAQGVGTIIDDDDPPALSIGDLTRAEGNGESSNANLPVTLSAPSGKTVTVQVSTANGTATAGADYTALNAQTLTLVPGDTSESAAVPVIGDTLDEPDETVTVTLAGPSNATVGDGQATLTITDDDAPPSVSIGDLSHAEGDAGSANAGLPVTLSAPSGKTVTVQVSTADGTATAGADYTALNAQTLTFTPGDVSEPAPVPVLGDTLDEPDETATATLASPANATTGDGEATLTVTDDDAPPALSVGDVKVTEGDSATTPATFTVSIGAASGRSVSASYATADGTAGAPGDYQAASGTVTIPAGQTSATVTAQVAGDTADEPDETFTLALSGEANASVTKRSGTATIADDDPESRGEGPIQTSGSGTVLVRRPGAPGFTPLDFGDAMELGTIVDATRGVVKLVVPCVDCPGGVQSAEFYAGTFVCLRTRGAKPIWDIVLIDAYNAGKPVKNGIPKSFASGWDPVAALAAKRTLVWGKGKGRWRTTGRHGAASIRGTKWLVDDRKPGQTRIKVAEGVVTVRDFELRKTVKVKAGKSYVARAKKKKKPKRG
jgi:hypothetical protein